MHITILLFLLMLFLVSLVLKRRNTYFKRKTNIINVTVLLYFLFKLIHISFDGSSLEYQLTICSSISLERDLNFLIF